MTARVRLLKIAFPAWIYHIAAGAGLPKFIEGARDLIHMYLVFDT